MNKNLKEKAITLIALVITIVVLIILAGVAISLSLGENGLFNKAKTAKEEYTNAQSKEQFDIAQTANEIESYISGDRADNKVTYSYNEQVIGTWVDGKTLYQKTINCGSMPNNEEMFVEHGIQNIGEVVEIKGMMYRNSDNTYMPLQYVGSGQTTITKLDYYQGKIHIVTFCDRSNCVAKVTMVYTKTTD